MRQSIKPYDFLYKHYHNLFITSYAVFNIMIISTFKSHNSQIPKPHQNESAEVVKLIGVARKKKKAMTPQSF